MEVLKINSLSKSEKMYVRNLWNNEYPKSLHLESPKSFEDYLASIQSATHYLVKVQDVVVGWFVDFKRENQLWFAMIIARSFQGKQIGSTLLNEAKKRHNSLLGWVIDSVDEKREDGSIYPSPVEFYTKNDFVINDQTRLETPDLSAVQIEWNR